MNTQSYLSLEPTCASQAYNDPMWRSTMTDEFNALIRNNTWELVPPSPDQNLVGCKWVFRIKRNPQMVVLIDIKLD